MDTQSVTIPDIAERRASSRNSTFLWPFWQNLLHKAKHQQLGVGMIATINCPPRVPNLNQFKIVVLRVTKNILILFSRLGKGQIASRSRVVGNGKLLDHDHFVSVAQNFIQVKEEVQALLNDSNRVLYQWLEVWSLKYIPSLIFTAPSFDQKNPCHLPWGNILEIWYFSKILQSLRQDLVYYMALIVGLRFVTFATDSTQATMHDLMTAFPTLIL